MDLECKERFLSFASHYVSVLGHKFSWDETEKQIANLEKTHIKTQFVKNLFVKVVKLISKEEFEKLIPEKLKNLLQEKESTINIK